MFHHDGTRFQFSSPGIHDASVSEVARGCSNLQTLDLDRCRLQTLDLDRCRKTMWLSITELKNHSHGPCQNLVFGQLEQHGSDLALYSFFSAVQSKLDKAASVCAASRSACAWSAVASALAFAWSAALYSCCVTAPALNSVMKGWITYSRHSGPKKPETPCPAPGRQNKVADILP